MKTVRQFFERTLQYSKNKLSNIKTKIISEYNSRDTYKDLAPIDNISNKNEYLKALHWAIKNKRIKNIALTGPYGSGKSSIINSYLKRHPLIKTRHLRISLATFIENTTDESEKPQKIKLDSKQIEEGILKQLFYKVNHHKIPQSRYRKLYRVKYLSAWLTIFFLFTFITLFLFVFKPEFFDNAVSLIIDAGVKLKLTQAHTCLSFCGIILLLISLITFIWRQLYSKVRISEIKVKETSIGTDKKEAESIFNKNMDEIIYFFEETKYRVVFFEDLDRLDSSKIFVQLRELNILLNNSDTIKHPIVFVYAVRDDIFTEKDRTKFFEFIIPVIPIINSTNSGEILLKLFSTKDCKSFKHDITFDYILDVSPYISDMRVLQNIHNEFLLYKRTLRTDQGLALDDKMMLSLIIFKNLYPKEFSDLQMESGIIKQAFKDKEQYIEKKRNILQEEIDASSDLIKKVNDDVLKSLQEIKVSLLCELTGWKGFTTEIGDSWRTDYTANQIMNPSFDLSKLLEFQSRYIRYDTWSGSSNSRINIPAFSELCAPYFERFERLNDYETKQLASIQKEIEDKKNLRSQLSSWSLKNTMAAVGDDAVLSSDVKSNKFLVFMLRKGYINEEYVNYINYFKGNSITIDDMNYILGIKDLEAKAFNYSLSKPEQVVQRLLPHEFKQKEALNFDILESLLSSTAYNDKLAAMMERLSDGTNLSWQFIDEFVNRTIYLPRFIQLLSQHWTQMWTCIYRNPILTYNRKIIYLSLLCMHTEIATLLDLNSEEKLITKFFEEHDDIFQKLSNVDPEKMVTIIPKLNIRFTKLNIKSVDNDILDCIFDNNFYQINPDMIQKIVTYKDPALCNKLQKQNYSTIMALGYSPLIEHIHANLPFYIDNIVLNGINRNENINQIISLLNLCITDVERCKKIIQFEVFRLSNISLCCGNQYTEHKEELEIISASSNPQLRTKHLVSEGTLDINVTLKENALLYMEIVPVKTTPDRGYSYERVMQYE